MIVILLLFLILFIECIPLFSSYQRIFQPGFIIFTLTQYRKAQMYGSKQRVFVKSEKSGGEYIDNENETNNQSKENIKFPIVQLIRNNELIGEFFCGTSNNMNDCISRIYSSMKRVFVDYDQTSYPNSETMDTSQSLPNSHSFVPNRPFTSFGWNGNYNSNDNIYSDAQLQSILSSQKKNSIVILKISRIGCKQCLNFDQAFYQYESTSLEKFVDFVDKNIQFYQTDESYIPLYMQQLTFQLSGRIQQTTRSDCPVCTNLGYLSCSECEGKGYVMKRSIAGFCPSCMGSKKIRCSACGGKCLQCG